jgi:hypothetical protein
MNFGLLVISDCGPAQDTRQENKSTNPSSIGMLVGDQLVQVSRPGYVCNTVYSTPLLLHNIDGSVHDADVDVASYYSYQYTPHPIRAAGTVTIASISVASEFSISTETDTASVVRLARSVQGS